jgi:hypothetical protein
MQSRVKRRVAVGVVAATSLLLAACGGSGDDATQATVEVVPVQEGATLDTSELVAAIDELTAKVDELSGRFVTNDDGSSGFAPATVPEIVTESTYGFGFPLPSGVSPVYAGLSDAEANDESGSLQASAGGVSVLLLWLSDDEPLTPSESVVSSFEVLQASTALDFSLLSSGEDSFSVDGEEAAYATFTAAEADSDDVLGVAVIGGWTCSADNRSFALTVTGTDQESVSTSFFELVNAFGCEA